MENSVVIEEYSSDWFFQYQKEAMKIREVLSNRILGIEHIGSTSVEGLGAKPIIDFMVGVSDLNKVDEFIEPLHKINYEHVFHKELPNRRFFRKGERGAGTHHLHMYKFGGEDWNNNILFRDYLKTHPDVLIQYCNLKKKLAEEYPNDRAAYTKAKHPFVTQIIENAKIDICKGKSH